MSERPSTPLRYRADIDGLRALAVLPVLFYHAGFDVFSGGYVGVDVFFVISGFLITSILISSLRTDKFSILEFYDRRIRRIFPALIFVLVPTLLAAYLLMLPKDLIDTGQSTFAAATFASNILFWFKTGYFAGPTETKALLHTWSLAVEEQFYVFFPIMLWLLWRFTRKYLRLFVGLLLVASFGLCIVAMEYDSSFAFYMLPTRAWELMVGALLALGLRTERFPTLLSILGLALIAVAVFGFDPATPFPGWAAALPVVGTALLINSGEQGMTSRLLAARPVVFIGLISYSLYLWHWPILVFAEYYTIRPLTMLESVAALTLSTILAWLSWRFVERPFRKHGGTNPINVIAIGLAAIALPGAVGLAIALSNGLPQRLPPQASAIADTSNYTPTADFDCTPIAGIAAGFECRVGSEDAGPGFAMWGDSHAGSYLQGIDNAAREAGVAGLVFTANGCPPVFAVQTNNATNDCDIYTRHVTDRLAQGDIGSVILVARWDTYEQPGKLRDLDLAGWSAAIAETVITLSQDHSVAITLAVPGSDYEVPSAAARRIWFGREVVLGRTRDSIEQRDAFLRDLTSQLADRGEVTVIDPLSVLCDESACPAIDAAGPRYTDSSHLSRAASASTSILFTAVDEAESP